MLKLLGPQKPTNSLRKTVIFTFASFPLPTRSRSPKRCPKSAQHDSQRLPRGAQELPTSPQEAPRGPQNHLRSAPGGPLGAKEASQGAFDSFKASFLRLRDLLSSFVLCFFQCRKILRSSIFLYFFSAPKQSLFSLPWMFEPHRSSSSSAVQF